ncbi:hypothetical protein [Primorskyibacter sp. S187A]|uniref:hypothetical protein n=1 Tax=Primorskyibacter sp. S187A TaxID=3415130 RepID=UPI003C7E2B43
MEQVRLLAPSEGVRLDQDRLQALYEELGDVGAEDVVCRAMEELAVRLSYAEKLFRQGDFQDMHKVVRSLVAISEQIGMNTLVRVAGDVCTCIEAGDHVALGATLSRLVRIGERSLSAIWDLDDFCP